MKLRQIVDEKFKKTVVKLLSQDMPIKTTILLKGVVELLNSEIEKYEAARQELLNQYGDRDAEGKLIVNETRNVQFSEANLAAYATAYSDLCNNDIEVPTITVEELGSKVTLSHDDLTSLGSLLAY